MKRILLSLFLLAPGLLLAQPEAGGVEALRAAVQSAREAGDQGALISALEDLGNAHAGLGDRASALGSFREALKLAREVGDQPSIAANLLAIGRIHVAEGRAPAGAETLRRAVAAAEAIGAEDVLRDAHGTLSQAYAALGQYRQAWESGRRSAELEQAADRRRAEQQAAELEARLESDRQSLQQDGSRQQEEVQRERQANAAREADFERLTKLVIVVGGVLSLLLLLSLFSRQRLKSRARKAASEKDAVLAAAESRVEQFTGELDRLTAQHDRTLGERQQLSNELGEAVLERDRLLAERVSLAEKLERTSGQLERTFIELEQTTADRDQLASELEHTATAGQRAVAEVERQSEHLAHVTAEAERISDRLTETAVERDLLIHRLGKASDELEKLRQDCAQDISAMADRNAAARERLLEMERFNSTLSQHLKVLLVTVRSALGALQQDAAAGDVEQLKKDVRSTHQAIGRTVRLLDELQKLLLVGRVTHTPEIASMSELAFEAVGQVADLADRRVDVVIAPAMPAVYGDRAQLLEVLRRLLENGGKYMGAQPSPRLEVAVRKDWPKADSPQTVFFVRDNGIGIEASDQKRVFSLFERLDAGGEGLGISLALVKRIVEAHGGRIWVESEGKVRGSTFCFTLAEPEASAAPATPAT